MLVLGLGTNIGDKLLNLKTAEEVLSQYFGNVIYRSKTYETPAWGFESDDSFYNNVIVFNSNLSPDDILEKCKSIEKNMGRIKNDLPQYESRIIDIDILLFNNKSYNKNNLTIPHKLIGKRLFVLHPLLDVLKEMDEQLYLFYKKKLHICNDLSEITTVKT